MRTTFAILLAAIALALPATAAAKSFTARAGGVTATLSYAHGPGIETTDERLKITAKGMPSYDAAVPAKGCFKVCSPIALQPVQVVDLYGDGEEAVVLNLFSGGADCCGIEQVYVPSAAVRSWVLSWRNFGVDGARVARENGHEVFLSGDNAFYCTFTFCYASGLPLEVESFTGETFHNVTGQYPNLIRNDAAKWLKTYYAKPSAGEGVIAAWAGDDDELGLEATVRTVLQRQIADHHLTVAFVAHLEAFLKQHGYEH
jgi:hypothetical protein